MSKKNTSKEKQNLTAKSKKEQEKQLSFLAKQAQELNLGYEEVPPANHDQ